MASASGTRRARGSSDNDIRYGRDGIFVRASSDIFRGNRFRDLRFGVHYMYTNDSEIERQRLLRQPRRVRHHVFAPAGRARQSLRRRPRPRAAVQLRQRLADHRQLGHRPPPLGACDEDGAEDREHAAPGGGEAEARHRASACSSTTPTITASPATASRAAASASTSPRLRAQRHHRQRLHRQPQPGEVRRHPAPRLVARGARQLLVRRPGLRPDRDGIADAAYRPNDLIDRVLWTAPRPSCC